MVIEKRKREKKSHKSKLTLTLSKEEKCNLINKEIYYLTNQQIYVWIKLILL